MLQLQELCGITFKVCVCSAAVREVVLWFLHVVFKLFLFWGNHCEETRDFTQSVDFLNQEVPPSILSQMLMKFYK